jgi:hypothetical protein
VSEKPQVDPRRGPFNVEPKQVSFHRNGVGGIWFFAVLFSDTEEPDSEERREFLGIVFDKPGECACICLDLIPEDGVTFGKNSWRGDVYEPWLRWAIETMPSSGSVRVGPFAFPTEPNDD